MWFFLLGAMLYHGIHDRNHKYWNIVSIEKYTPDAGAAGKPRYQSTIFMLNKCQRIPKGQCQQNNSEKLPTQGTQDDEKQNKLQHHYAQTSTNNVNKTCALVHTAGGKDKLSIV